jgi:flagellar hook-associated protein 3 FlgL
VRITSEVMVTRSLDRLGTRLQQYERTQNQLSSGKRILAASDDPAGARRAASLRGAMQAREQELRNAADATGWLDTADSQLQSAMNRLNRVHELALRGASDTSNAERRALANEIREITEEIAGIANATHLGRPLFGGFGGGPAVEKVDGVWVANGTDDQVTRRVTDSEQVRINVTAGEWLGFGSPDGDLLTQLEGLVVDLESGTQADVTARIRGLEGSRLHVADALGAVGAATNRVVSATQRTNDLLVTLRNELSEIEDVDIAQGIVELQVQQVAYEATLQALGRALPPSLVAFLR